MKRSLYLLGVASLVFGAASASAAGINLGWNDCPGGAYYALAEMFACDTNEGVHTLVGSFVAPAGVLGMSGNEIVIDMQTSGAALAPWWSLRASAPAGCRPTALTQSGDFTAGPFTCFDYWQGGASGATSMDPPVANRARIKAIEALPAESPLITSIAEGTEVYSFMLRIENSQTVDPGSCGGCTDEACIVLTSIRIIQPVEIGPIINVEPNYPLVLWQGWSTTDPVYQCPWTVPARTQTWGSIKALYR